MTKGEYSRLLNLGKKIIGDHIVLLNKISDQHIIRNNKGRSEEGFNEICIALALHEIKSWQKEE